MKILPFTPTRFRLKFTGLKIVSLVTAALLTLARPGLAAATRLVPHAPIVVPGGPGGFDWMSVDSDMGRLFACHPGTKSVTMLNLTTGKITSLDAGQVNGLGIDPIDNKYFAAGAGQKLIVFDRKTLIKTDEIPLTGPGDQVLFEPRNRKIYIDNDDGTKVWVVDAVTNKITNSISIGEAPEEILYNPVTDRLYQNIKLSNQLQVIDPATNTIVASWPTAPANGPHGMVIDSRRGRIFTAGSNGQLAVLNLQSGKLVASVPIAKKADQIAFDPRTRRIYCACAGVISIVQETMNGGAVALGNVASHKGAHTITVDPATGDVWICYSDARASYLQRFTLP